MVPVSRAVGRKRALELLLTGDPIDAETACEWGLINRVVGADELEAEVSALVAKVAGSSALTVSIGKEAFYEQIDLDERGAYSVASEVMASNALPGQPGRVTCPSGDLDLIQHLRGRPDGVPKRPRLVGRCSAAISAPSFGFKSWAKSSGKNGWSTMTKGNDLARFAQTSSMRKIGWSGAIRRSSSLEELASTSPKKMPTSQVHRRR